MFAVKTNDKKTLVMGLLLGAFVTVVSGAAQAVPSFARQTGMECSACHTIFPQLTPFGREFKLGGYVMSDGQEKKLPPLSAGAQFTYTSVEKKGDEAEGWRVPQALSVYYGGKITSKVGTLTQVSYTKEREQVFLDMADIRYADQAIIGGAPLTYGVTLNNMPTFQDAWNSTPAYMFPYEPQAIAPTPAAGTGLSDPVSMRVAGLGAYAYWNNLVYAELTGYRSREGGAMGKIQGIAPYWRLAVQGQKDINSFAAGVYGISGKARLDASDPMFMMLGETQRYRDIGLDAQYQSIGDPHIFSAYATWIKRSVKYDEAAMMTPVATKLDIFRVNGSYSFRRKYAAMLGYFAISGDADPLLYPMEAVAGSGTGSPNSNGYIAEVNYLPRQDIKLALQYTAYNKFNGASNDYDGFGRNASDNNTAYLLANFMF